MRPAIDDFGTGYSSLFYLQKLDADSSIRKPAIGELEGKADRALQTLEEGFEDVTSILTLPGKYRRRLRTTNMVERFIQEIRRREKVLRISPTIASARRMVGALCAEQHGEWSTGRRYLNMDEYEAWKSTPHSPDPDGKPLPQAV